MSIVEQSIEERTDDQRPMASRRSFLKALAIAGIAGKTLLTTGSRQAAADAIVEPASQWPKVPKRTLGRTGFEAGRLVMGCGAALSGGRKDALLDAAFEAGVNVFDVGSANFYGDAEKNLAPFLAKRRDDVFLISKAMVGLEIEPDAEVSVAQAKQAAATWTSRMEQSLRDLSVDKVDAYYLMASNNPSVISSEEIKAAFDKAKTAGKVDHLGLSTHQNAHAVLKRAAQTGWFSLAMIAITPGGWYDWKNRSVLEGSPPMSDIQPFLASLRKTGMGLVGMKAGRFLAGRRYIGWSKPDAFDDRYDEPFMKSGMSAFQRSYAYVLGHGLDVANADMQSMAHLRENVIAASRSSEFFEA